MIKIEDFQASRKSYDAKDPALAGIQLPVDPLYPSTKRVFVYDNPLAADMPYVILENEWEGKTSFSWWYAHPSDSVSETLGAAEESLVHMLNDSTLETEFELSVSIFNGEVPDADIEQIVGLEGGDRGTGFGSRDIHFTLDKPMTQLDLDELLSRLEQANPNVSFEVGIEAWPKNVDLGVSEHDYFKDLVDTAYPPMSAASVR